MYQLYNVLKESELDLIALYSNNNGKFNSKTVLKLILLELLKAEKLNRYCSFHLR